MQQTFMLIHTSTKRIRDCVIIDLVKEDIRDHVLYDKNDGEYYYKDVYDPNLVVVKVTVGKGTCWDT